MSSKNNHRKRSRRSYHSVKVNGMAWRRTIAKTYIPLSGLSFFDRIKKLFKAQ